MVIETVSFLPKQIKSGKNVLVEGANAAMLDIDFGKSLMMATLPGSGILLKF